MRQGRKHFDYSKMVKKNKSKSFITLQLSHSPVANKSSFASVCSMNHQRTTRLSVKLGQKGQRSSTCKRKHDLIKHNLWIIKAEWSTLMNKRWMCPQNREKLECEGGTRHGSSFSNRWVCDVLSAPVLLTRLMCTRGDTFIALVFAP